MPIARPARIALVGERSAEMQAHSRYAQLLAALRQRDRLVLDAYWLSTVDVAQSPEMLRRFDGVWLTPGSPYRSEIGALAAVRTAREHDIPFLATCGGFTHALLEFARDVCGLHHAAHAEYGPDSENLLIVPTAEPLVGHRRRVNVVPGSLAARILGTGATVERYQCTHELADRYIGLLQARGLRFTGYDDAGRPRIAELPDHRFFLAVSFQPELTPGNEQPHPIARAFGAAAVQKGRA